MNLYESLQGKPINVCVYNLQVYVDIYMYINICVGVYVTPIQAWIWIYMSSGHTLYLLKFLVAIKIIKNSDIDSNYGTNNTS